MPTRKIWRYRRYFDVAEYLELGFVSGGTPVTLKTDLQCILIDEGGGN